MSIKVDLDELAAAIDAHGTDAYVITVGDDARVHLIHNRITIRDRVLVTTPGNSSRRNAAVNAAVVVLWPPRDATQLSLIVDGTAAVEGDDLVITPTHAILHRRADTV
jgi:hypothetical protein